MANTRAGLGWTGPHYPGPPQPWGPRASQSPLAKTRRMASSVIGAPAPRMAMAGYAQPPAPRIDGSPYSPCTSMNTADLERKTFITLLIAVTLAFGFILWPFSGAVFWGATLAILFSSVHRWLLMKWGGRANLAALGTLAIILLLVILPVALITASLVQEATSVYARLQSGDLNFTQYFRQIMGSLPQWALDLLDRVNMGDAAAVQEKVGSTLTQGSKTIASQVLSIGQNTFDFLVSFFVMLYLLFFLIRDGALLAMRIRDAIPLNPDHKRDLFGKFTTVIRATVKGNIAVAVAQGALGGVAFWMVGVHGPVLWGVLMAFLSLLPAVGAAIIWAPVALYFLATGAFIKAGILVFIGVFVIGLVDNILRPLLVGKDTKMPDYIVLISTIGGMAIFGLNGFVIGPAVAAMFIAVWTLFTDAKRSAATVTAPAPAPAAASVPDSQGQ